MGKAHEIKLTNGTSLLVEEGRDGISIAAGDGAGNWEAYICTITPDGVLVYPNSGDACADLAKSREGRTTAAAQTELCNAVCDLFTLVDGGALVDLADPEHTPIARRLRQAWVEQGL